MRPAVWRPWLVHGVGSTLLLGEILFLAYVTGWPATADSCINGGNCYCEDFSVRDVESGAKGIRQPVNTWSNLYALITAAIVAYVLSRDRDKGASANVMRSDSPIADAYVFAVLFLGLGSMWLHASMSSAVSWMDGFSMYVFAGFLVFYTIDRILANNDVSQTVRNHLFWIGWPVNAVLYANIAGAGVPSFALIGVLVLAYVVLELIAGWLGWKDVRACIYWFCGLAAMGIATTFWKLSEDDGLLCFPDSWFQPHGLIWHTFAGVMAVMMFFYWRRENRVQEWR